VVSVSASYRAAGVSQAVAGVASATEAMTAVAREHTEQRRIASSGFSVWPAHDQQGRPDGFEARHGVRIVLPDLDTAGEFLGALAEAVGDRLTVESVALEVAETAAALTAAREAAYADARDRAAHLAGLDGKTLGELRAVEENGATPGVPVGVARMAAAKDMSFAPGEASITTSVTATWLLED